MSLLNRHQRAIIAIDTGIDPLIIDRATEAFDAVIERDDIETYRHLMGNAIAQMGYERPIRPQDRPTAVDVIKTILLTSYARRERISYQEAVKHLRRMLKG